MPPNTYSLGEQQELQKRVIFDREKVVLPSVQLVKENLLKANLEPKERRKETKRLMATQVMRHFFSDGTLYRYFVDNLDPREWETYTKAIEELDDQKNPEGTPNLNRYVNLYFEFTEKVLSDLELSDPEAFQKFTEDMVSSGEIDPNEFERILSAELKRGEFGGTNTVDASRSFDGE